MIAVSWRRLTGGRAVRDQRRRTLVACSGGADSSALLIVLSRAGAAGSVVAGHVRHDMRSPEEATADRDSTRILAERLGVPFVEGQVSVRGLSGNVEGLSRSRRYEELARLASESGCPYIATGHHADDQLETVLMRLLRGAGPGGLAGIARTRRLNGGDPPRRVVRPMLGVTRSQTESICREAGWTWAEDATNADRSGLRSALRMEVLPALRTLNPAAARKAVEAADLCRAAWEVVRARTAELDGRRSFSGGVVAWTRSALRESPPVVAAEALRHAIILVSGGQARDRITRRSLWSVIRAVRNRSGETRTFQWRGATVVVEADRVEVRVDSVREMSGK